MSEEPKKEIVVKIDSTPRELRLQGEYEQKIKEKDELIKALLTQDKLEFTPNRPKKAHENPENTAILTNEPSYQDEHVLRNIDYENSDIPLEWIRGKNEAEVIEKVEGLAKIGNKDCKNIMSKLTRKIIHDKPIDMIFIGSNIDFMRSPKPINENMGDEEQERRKKLNERFRQNRFKWSVN